MYKRAISIDKSDVVTHSDDFDAPGKSIFRKFPKFWRKILFLRNSLSNGKLQILFGCSIFVKLIEKVINQIQL